MRKGDSLVNRFAVGIGLFAVLVAPWPGLDSAYGTWTRALGNAVFRWENSRLQVSFGAIPRTRWHPLDTRITLVNPIAALPDGRLRTVMLDLDMRGIGWIPTAFLAALVVATPIPWGRRGKALAVGMCAIQAFILLSIAVHILRYSDAAEGIGVLALGAPWKGAVDGLDETLINQLGAGFLAATCAWLMATMRWEGWKALVAPVALHEPAGSPAAVLRQGDNTVIHSKYG
jgi:hypothetical protein